MSAFVSSRAAVLGFALCALSACQLRHSWRWKPQCGAWNDNFFFCVSAASTVYNSLPNPALDICKTLVSVFASSYFLVFLPQLSYFAHHSTYNQLSMCQKAISTVCVRSTILFIHLNGLLLRNKGKKRPKWLWPWIAFMRVSVCFFSIIKWSAECILLLQC